MDSKFTVIASSSMSELAYSLEMFSKGRIINWQFERTSPTLVEAIVEYMEAPKSPIKQMREFARDPAA